MGLFEYSVRHLLGAAYQGGGICFSGNTLYVAVNGRITAIQLTEGRSHTLPYESSRTLRSLTVGGNSILAVNSFARATLLMQNGTLRSNLAVPLMGLTAACVSPCGKHAAFSNATETSIWRIPEDPVPGYADFDCLQTFRAGATCNSAMAWSSDSKRLAIAGRDGTCRVFTLRRAGEERRKLIPLVLHGHREPIIVVRFCGKRGFVTISRDGAMFCWRLRFNDVPKKSETGSTKPTEDEKSGGEEFEGSEKSEELDPESDLESGDDESDEEDQEFEDATNPGEMKRGWFLPVEAFLFSRHFVKKGGARRIRSGDISSNMVVVGMSNGVFALFKLPAEMAEGENEDLDRGFFELRQDVIDTRKEQKKRAREMDPELMVQKPRMPSSGFTELELVHELSVSAGALTDIVFNDSGEWIALASSHSGQVIVWEWRSETHILKQQSHTLTSTASAFSADGRALASGSLDGRIKLWGVSSGFCAATFADHTAAVTGIAFAGKDVVVSSSLDGTVRAFDIRRYRNFRVLVAPPPQRQFGCVAVDLSGDLIAAGCIDTFEVFVWSLRTGNVVEVLAGHKGPVSSLAFRPRRGTLATASWDRTVRLWDMYEKKGSCEVLEHSKEVLSVAFRPDGEEFASCTLSGEITLWNAETGTITGTIDGGRDAAPGRSRASRTVAPKRGHFQSLSYSADGRLLLCGAASKYVCVYIVADGISPSLVDKHAVTRNQDFDALKDHLNSKNLTSSGHSFEDIEFDDEDAESYGETVMARRRSQPGAPSEALTKRKNLQKAEVKCVRYSPTGRMWAAVTHEGVLLYGEGDGRTNNSEDTVFDPVNLGVDITPKSAEQAANDKQYRKALMIALRLGERSVLNRVLEKIPTEEISLVVDQISSSYFVQLVSLLAWRIENTPHIDFNLLWARRLLLRHGGQAHLASRDGEAVNTALRALLRVTTAQSKKLTPVADKNQYTLAYLKDLSQRKSIGAQ